MKSIHTNDWIIRSATQGDIAGICEVIDAYSLDLHGIHNDAKRNVELTWGQPGFRLDADTRVAVSPEGRIIGYAEVEDVEEPHVRVGSWIRIHPESRDSSLASQLLSWVEDRAREAIGKAPEEARVTVGQGISDKDSQLQVLFTDSGYNITRHFWRMTIELDHDIPEPIWPNGVAVRTFEFEADLENMVHAFRDSFQDHWGHVERPFEQELKQWDHWIRNDKEFDCSLTFLAVVDDNVVGFATCDATYAEDPAMGHAAVLGVRRAWRQRGIALALLHHTFREFQHRGQKRVGVGVDAASLTGAQRLYEVTGMKPTRQINAFEKELRAGVDLSLQALDDGDVSS